MHYDDYYVDVAVRRWLIARLVIAAAGAHNLLMRGPPGSGKREYNTFHDTVPSNLPLTREVVKPPTGSEVSGLFGFQIQQKMTAESKVCSPPSGNRERL